MLKYQSIPVTAFQQNCSLVWCDQTNKAAFIDPGGDAEQLIKAVERYNVTLESILLTHGHLDHVGASKTLSSQFDVPIIGPHKNETIWFDNLPQQAQMFNLPHIEPFLPDQWLNEDETTQVGNLTFRVLQTPGHTPGHIIFFEENNKTAFVGDVLFKGSIGRTDFPQGDHDELIHSIKTKLLPLGDDVTIVPGHGPTSTLGLERISNPYLK